MGNVALRDAFFAQQMAGRDIRQATREGKFEMQCARTVSTGMGKWRGHCIPVDFLSLKTAPGECLWLSDCHAIPAIPQVFVPRLGCGLVGSSAALSARVQQLESLN
jgi:hypothetical protein